jgi:EmrB/QacA subfamily drug resistance transporter
VKSTPRWTLIATILGSSLGFVDATVVNVAIPGISRDLGGGAAAAQWIIAAYLLPLASFVLVGGALSDRFGHRRTFLLGLVGFGIASIACGASQSVAQLVAARAVQGTAAALLMPASLALLGVRFSGPARGKAIGTWSAFGSVASAVGPVLGGWLVDHWSWRYAFFINLPVAIAAGTIGWCFVPAARQTEHKHIDVPGAVLAILALGALTAALTLPDGYPTSQGALAAAGTAAFAVFLWRERHARDPMMPLDVWRSRLFSSVNALTFVVYAALSLFMFVLPIRLIVGGGHSATMSAAALLPIVIELFVLSRWTGQWASAAGPRVPLALGAMLVSAGFALLALLDARDYWRDVLPGVAVLGLGMALTVAPLTTAVMSALGDARAGLASGINNAVARTAGLGGVSAAALIAGAQTQRELAGAFPRVMIASALLSLAGGAIAVIFVRRPPS